VKKEIVPAQPPTDNNLQQKLLLLSFFEGACVMVAELAGGKMLAPFYGTSLYVWASTLAITLGGLAIGYYYGGELSRKAAIEKKKYLFFILCAAAALVMIMPFTAAFVMQQTMGLSFLTGVVVSQLLFLLPPVLCMGTVSPLLIGLISESNNPGKAAGMVYAISTLGGVIATLLTGFWLVPLIGISLPCTIMGGLLFVLVIIILRPRQKIVIGLFLLLLLPAVYMAAQPPNKNTNKYKVLYHSEGMMGQVKVVDFTYTNKGRDDRKIEVRTMLVNHNWQTWIDRNNKDFSFLYYTRFTKAVISSMQAHSTALLIGLGGGSVAHQLENSNIAYDAVEIDGRLPMLAEKYFGLKLALANTVVDDGRHYINVCKKKYDLVIIDALLGENIPSHLLSVECFTKIKKLLNNNGKIFIEFDGIDDGEDGKAQQMLYSTLQKAGYSTRVFSIIPGKPIDDIIYVATNGIDNSYDTTQIPNDFYFNIPGKMKFFEVTDLLNMPGTPVITDDYPVLDIYLRNKMVAFREKTLSEFNADFMEDNMSFFK
jgi:predicted membrane-bound spermidine synthase